jgi:hypothetical protein
MRNRPQSLNRQYRTRRRRATPTASAQNTENSEERNHYLINGYLFVDYFMTSGF